MKSFREQKDKELQAVLADFIRIQKRSSEEMTKNWAKFLSMPEVKEAAKLNTSF